MKSIFSGRYNRAKYLYLSLLVAVPIVVIAVVASYTRPVGNSTGPIQLLSIICSVALFPIGIKRLHDIDMSGGFYLLCLIPGANVIMGLLLLFKKGTKGSNKHGPDPLSST